MPRWMTGFAGAADQLPKIQKKLASSGSLDALKKLIAEFYYTKPERITFVERGSHWQVQSGEKLVTPVVVRQGKRFVFGVAASSGLAGADFATGESYLGYEIKTLSSYNTPYYYADGPFPLGSVNHFQTIRALKNYMDRKVKAGKLRPRG